MHEIRDKARSHDLLLQLIARNYGLCGNYEPACIYLRYSGGTNKYDVT